MPLRLFKAGLSPVRVRSARYRIELSALTSYLESLHADLPADATVQVQLSCGRFNGDFAHGLITATFDSSFALLTIASGWEAGTQPRPEHGWYVMPRGEPSGELLSLRAQPERLDVLASLEVTSSLAGLPRLARPLLAR